MALINCIECGKEYSDKAISCPNCGCPTTENLSKVTIVSNIVENNEINAPPSQSENIEGYVAKKQEQIPTKNNIRMVKAVSIVFTILLISITAIIFWSSNTNYSAGLEAMAEGNYQEAIDRFESSFHSESQANIALAKKLITSNDEFQKGQDTWNYFSKTNNTRDFEEFFNDRTVGEKALPHYENVIPEDKNYKTAQSSIDDIKEHLEFLDNKEKAIELVKQSNVLSNSKRTEDVINSWINDNQKVYTVYGWDARYAFKITPIFDENQTNTPQEPDKSLFFVSFGFDYDDSIENGNRIYCFEANIESGTVMNILGNSTLKKKYQDWGYIN